MRLRPLGLLNQGKIVECTGDFLIDSINGLAYFKEIKKGSSIILDNEGAGYLMLMNESFLEGFTNVVINPLSHYGDVLEADSLDKAISLCPQEKDAYFLAGENLFKEALDYARLSA